jgi:hypothetical protein
MFNWTRNKSNMTIENFMFGKAQTTGKNLFIATFTLEGKIVTAKINCTPKHLQQLVDLAGRHYAGIRYLNYRRKAVHLEMQQRMMYITNAILYVRKTSIDRKDRGSIDAAFVLDFIVDSTSSDNDNAWHQMERALVKIKLDRRYREYVRFLKLTKDEAIARHCAGLEDLELYNCAYVHFMSPVDDGTEDVPVEAEQ